MEHEWTKIFDDYDSYGMVCINCKLEKVSKSSGIYYFHETALPTWQTFPIDQMSRFSCDKIIIKGVIL